MNKRSDKNKGGELKAGKIKVLKIPFDDGTVGMFSCQVGETWRLFETSWLETTPGEPEEVPA